MGIEVGLKGKEMLTGTRACSFEFDISFCLLCLCHNYSHFYNIFAQMILPNHVLFGHKVTPLLVEF